MSDKIIYKLTKNSQIATITLNNPKFYNALDGEMLQAITKYLAAAAKDPAVKVLVINAKGKHFSSGADLKWMQQAINFGQSANYRDAASFAKMLFNLYNLPKPVVCAIEGKVYAGAIGIIACADLVVAAADTSFCFSEVKLGLAPAMICPFVMQASASNAIKHKMLTATPFGAKEAYQYGLVQVLVPSGQQVTQALAEQLEYLVGLEEQGLIVTKKLWGKFKRKITWKDLEQNIKILAKLRATPVAQQLLQKFLIK